MKTSTNKALDIKTYGDPVLREKSKNVTEFDETFGDFVAAMVDTMRVANGLGLAAQQVGHLESVCVIEVPEDADTDESGMRLNPTVAMPLVLVNATIVASDGAQTMQEGCLSFPDIYATVKRAMTVTVNHQDSNGTPHTLVATGLLARVIQHELDHLDGVLIVDRMSAAKRVALSGRLKRLRKSHQ